MKSTAKFLIPYMDGAPKDLLEKSDDAVLGYLDYDWNLNDIKKK